MEHVLQNKILEEVLTTLLATFLAKLLFVVSTFLITLHACTRGKVIGLCGFVCRHCCRRRPSSPQNLPVWEI